MENINQVVISGFVAIEPAGRVMSNGKSEYVANIVCRELWTDSNTGLSRQSVNRFHVVFYGRLGDQASEVLKAGMQVRVTGRLRTRDLKVDHCLESNATFIEATQFDLSVGDDAVKKARRFDSEFGPLRP
jgi:single-strand DNA-binding protein